MNYPPNFPKEMPFRPPAAVEPDPQLSRTHGRVELESDPRTDMRLLERGTFGRGSMRKPTDSAPEAPAPILRMAHGALFVVLMAITALIQPLRFWPWFWLAPFGAYFAVVAMAPDLRGSAVWLRAGKVSAGSIAATIGLIALTVLILTRFQAAFHPDVSSLRSALPLRALGGVAIACVVFSLLNAALEEFVFRGVLFDSLQARWGSAFTLAVTSLLFGLGHLTGYPPGPFGACLAALFGCALGLLRLRTGGLALPIAAHIAADATIFWIVSSATG